VLYYIRVMKFVKLENFNILADFRVLLHKSHQFIEFAYIVILEDFR